MRVGITRGSHAAQRPDRGCRVLGQVAQQGQQEGNGGDSYLDGSVTGVAASG